MNDVTSSRGGAGRGQGRKPISPEGAKAYKLLLTDEQRAKLEKLGNAAWIREQIDFATHLEQIDMTKAVNLSARYIHALRQLPQYICNTVNHGPLTHALTGVQVLPTGELTDPEDDYGGLQLVYPGGHSIVVHGHAFLKMAVKEAAEIEIDTTPEEFEIPEKKYTNKQLRIADYLRHFSIKHGV